MKNGGSRFLQPAAVRNDSATILPPLPTSPTRGEGIYKKKGRLLSLPYLVTGYRKGGFKNPHLHINYLAS
jgi:hypothetical protein